MHPLAGPEECKGKVIDSHSIQRKGPLRKLVDGKNHVCHLEATPNGIALDEIGWRKASVFPGYCEYHDTKIFGSLENAPFTGTHEQCVLQAYRSVCNDLYKKRALIESLEYQRDVIDKGCQIDEQINRQLSISNNIAGQSKSVEELTSYWRQLYKSITEQDYDSLSSACYFFDGDLLITSAGALHVEFDFKGNKLFDMWDVKIDAQLLCHSIQATESGGAIVFAWFKDDELPIKVISSFDLVPDEIKGDVFAQYCFLNCENTFFSNLWWDNLRPFDQQRMKDYMGALFYEGGAFEASEVPLVGWNFTHYIKSTVS